MRRREAPAAGLGRGIDLEKLEHENGGGRNYSWLAPGGVRILLSSLVQKNRRTPDRWEVACRICLGALFALAAWRRFSLPQTLLVDSDYGYLWPVLGKLAGGAFAWFQGVNFLYPAAVLGLTSATGDFRAVTIVQHLLGLLAGGFFWLIWLRLALFLPCRGRLHAVLGLAGLAIYLLSNNPIWLETRLRPDSVCMFWEMLCCWLALEAFCAVRFFQREGRALFLATLAGLSCVALTALKPSFLLAALLLLALLAWLVVRLRRPVLEKAIFFLLPLAALCSIAATQRALTRDDEMTQLFLPQTLFAFHARLIDAQMQRDLARGVVPDEQRKFLAQAAADLAKETERGRGRTESFPRLGYDPDYLVNGHDALLWRWRYSLGKEAYPKFLRFWYWHSLRAEPLAFAGKIAGQIGVFYRWNCPAFWTHRRLPLDYAVSQPAIAEVKTAKLLEESSAGRALAAQLQALRFYKGSAREPFLITEAQKFIGGTFLAVFLASLAGIFAFVRRGFGAAAGLLLILYTLVFGNVLSISAIHTMEVSRYSEVLFLVALLAYLWALRCGIEWFRARPGAPAAR